MSLRVTLLRHRMYQCDVFVCDSRFFYLNLKCVCEKISSAKIMAECFVSEKDAKAYSPPVGGLCCVYGFVRQFV